MFKADFSDIKALEKFYSKKVPQSLPRSTANLLTSLAFEGEKIDIEILSKNLIIRNNRMLNIKGNPFLRVQKARATRIENQRALVGSIERPRFTGWKEQETGGIPKLGRAATTHARGGRKQSVMKSRARLQSKHKFHKPSEFPARTLRQQYIHMLRVINNRGGQQYFMLQNNIRTGRGTMKPGLYLLRAKKISLLQGFNAKKAIKKLPWNEMMINILKTRNTVDKLWQREHNRLYGHGYKY